VGTALGFGIGGQVTEYFDNWRYAFYVVGLPGLAIAFAALLIHEPPRGTSEGPDEGAELRRETLPASWSIYATLCRNRSFVFTTLGMAMMTFAIGGLANWVPKFISLERGLGLKKASLYMGAVICIAGLVGTALGGIIADPLARRIRGAYFWLSGLTMLASVPLIWLALVAHPTWLIFGSMALGLIFVFVGTGPSNAIVVNVTPPNIRAAAFAVNIFALHILGDIPSPPLMGLISDATNNMYYGLVIAIPALVLSALFFCAGARFLEADQKTVVYQVRSSAV
jgi:MFS family permease